MKKLFIFSIFVFSHAMEEPFKPKCLLSLGFETHDGKTYKLIDGNTPIPTRKSFPITTGADNQTSVDIRIVQGEHELAKDNKLLGKVILQGIPAAPRSTPKLEGTLDIDARGIVNVAIKDKSTGKEQKVTIPSTRALLLLQECNHKARTNIYLDELMLTQKDADILSSHGEIADQHIPALAANMRFSDAIKEGRIQDAVDIFYKNFHSRHTDREYIANRLISLLTPEQLSDYNTYYLIFMQSSFGERASREQESSAEIIRRENRNDKAISELVELFKLRRKKLDQEKKLKEELSRAQRSLEWFDKRLTGQNTENALLRHQVLKLQTAAEQSNT